jgi:Holliday junction resolvase
LAEVTHKNKVRGNNLEREIVNEAKDMGMYAKRAYASDGRSLGKSEVVDVIVEDTTIQAKRRKKVAQWLYPDYHGDDVDAVVTRMDRKEALAIIPLKRFLRLLQIEKENRDGFEQERS